MAHRLDDFVAGVVATFGSCFMHQREVDDLAQAAQEFYLDLRGLPHGTMAQLPFWRYLMHASAVLVDRAACMPVSASEQEEQDPDLAIDEAELEAATAMTSYWPFLATMVTRQYRYRHSHRRAGSPQSVGTARTSSTAEVGVQTEEPPPEDRQSNRDVLHAPATAGADVMRAPPSQALGPPSMLASPAFDFAQPSPAPAPYQPDNAISNPFFSPSLVGAQAAPKSRPMLRASSSRSSSVSTKESLRSSSHSHGGRTLSNSTESSNASTEATSVQTIKSEGSTPDPTLYRGAPAHITDETSSLPANRGNEAPTPRASPSIQPHHSMRLQAPPLRRTKSLEPTLILSDRGDNAAKLLPTLEGSYVVQVSIGGRKLLLNPERPGEIQYHDSDGKVVTRSLAPSDEEDAADV